MGFVSGFLSVTFGVGNLSAELNVNTRNLKEKVAYSQEPKTELVGSRCLDVLYADLA